MRALIIEDDVGVATIIKSILETQNFVVNVAHAGQEGFDMVRFSEYDIVLLDMLLPDMSGHDFLQRLRATRVTTPVLILSGVKERTDIIQGIDQGADDYLTKPFSKEELLARMRAIVRRTKGHAGSTVAVGPLTVNLKAQQAEVNGNTLNLTCKEYGILELLVLRKGSTLSKEMFLNHLYGGIDEPEPKIIDVFVCKLRKKIADALGREENYIQTVWGRGYVLRESDKQKVDSPGSEKIETKNEGEDAKSMETESELPKVAVSAG